MKTIKQTYHIKAPVEKVWQALVDPKEIDNWGAGPAKMSESVGAEFGIWGGDIHGKNIEVERNKKLVQEWSESGWITPSIVTFELSEESDGTKIDLVHENVPDEEADDIDDGWKRYYLGEIKKYLEK